MSRSGDLDQVRFEGRPGDTVMRTLTAYGIGVIIVLAILHASGGSWENHGYTT